MDKQTEGGRLQTLGHCTNPTRSKGRAVKTTTLIPHEARVLGRHHLRLADVVTWDLEISIKHGGRGSGKALHGSESGFQGLLAFAHGSPLHCSRLENFTAREAWRVAPHRHQ